MKGRLYLLSLSLVGGVIVIVLFGSINPLSLFTSYPFHMPGIMGPNMMDTQNIMTIQGQPISVQQAIQMMRSIPSYAKVVSHNNTIIFSSKDANIVALAMMPERAVNLTGMLLPSYSKGDVFVIYGLINPTLVIPKGTSVQFRVINLDDDMYHNLAISSFSPPYPYMAMMSSIQYNRMMSFLPRANEGLAHEYSYTLTLDQSGNLWYLCTYPGHAQDGMYGKIVVAS
jgi:rusticyanin